MKLPHTNIKLIAASLMCGLVIVSCKKDETISVSEEPAVESDIVSFDISASGSWAPDVIGDEAQTPTRSGAIYSQTLPMDCEGDGEALPEEICIYMIEEDNPDQAKDAMPLTKAGGDEQTPETLYGIYAYLGKGSASQPSYEGVTTFMNNLELFSDGKYSGEDKYWPGNGWWLEFFAYSPYLTNDSQSASYIENCITYPTIHHTVSADVANHIDIMAGKSDKIDGNFVSTVNVEVSHILSKVQVKVGTVSCGQITSLKISGVNDCGVYSLAGRSWSNQGVSSGTIADVAYTQTFTEPQQNNTLLGQPMYMIPQQMPESAKIEVVVEATIKNEVKNFTLSKNLKEFITEWKQDKQYTIVISTPHEVEVEVTDNVEYEGDYPVKKNLVIKNTGLTEAYIRVAVTGAWMVDDNTSGTEKKLTVSDWKETDGEFTWPSAGMPTTDSKNSNNWRLGPDGYYYYMMKTSPGQVLGTLFESYKLTAPSPMLGAYLELSILAQAFYVTDAEYVFPTEIFNNLDK